MRINRLEFEDYRLFTGKQEFVFDERLNLVEGGSGSGKTIMFNAMRDSLKASIQGVSISIEGDAKQILEHSDLVFISGENLIEKENIVKIVNSEDFIRVLRLYYDEHEENETLFGEDSSIYDELFPFWFKDFDDFYYSVLCMSLSDITLHIYLYLLKKRQETGLGLPLVIDRPFLVFDSEKRRFLANLLKSKCAQVILLGHSEDFMLPHGAQMKGKYLPIKPESNNGQ